ncbi:serine/threonine-protein kinase [Polyangium sp. 6x1]|uniref:serine/threonine protein kinase n=1 Tax=Polyangium sp. 6x1 TaxID=3042689 RepID=UPI002482819F|nr:serine/threonine-protein kinase [Polyangium sp. 6x1]MDI1449294.1 serine/threonine-protein kinase [Polyangium sp. 6x1]
MSPTEESAQSIEIDESEAAADAPVDVDQANAEAHQKALERARDFIGQTISGRYRIIDLLAMGGMGAVYLGEHALMHKRVAVKILHPESDDNPEIVARFEREALVGAHIDNPNIAHATDFGKLDDGSYFLILEYVDGKNLAEVIREGPMKPRTVVHVARQILLGLQAAHDLGIVHRDLKPRNVMLEAGFVAKLIDFGFAKVSVGKLPLTVPKEGRPPSRLTGVGVIFGTINYLAPEAAHGMDAVDERADLYALGVMMYEMLTGQHPFDSTDPVEMFSHHRTTPPPPFSVRAPDVKIPAELEPLVKKLLEKDPYERFQNAGAVIEALDALAISSEPVEEAAARSRKITPPPPPITVRPPEEPSAAPEPAKASEPASPSAARKKKKKAKGDELATSAKRAPEKKPSTINYTLAVIAIVAVAAAAFFASR